MAIASGTVVGVTVIVGQEMVIVALTLPLQPRVSVAVTVKLNVPAWVGVPERTPVGPSVRVGGSAPADTEKVCGAVPPAAAKAWEYGVAMVPPASAPPGVTVISGHVIVSVKFCVTGVTLPLVAVNVSGKVPPAPVGVPASVAVRSPLSVKVTPGGSAPVTVRVGTAPPPTVVTVKVPGAATVEGGRRGAREAHATRRRRRGDRDAAGERRIEREVLRPSRESRRWSRWRRAGRRRAPAR